MFKKILAIIGLVGIGTMGRLVPHIPNMTPITAIAVTGSKYVGKWWAVCIPITAMFFSDAIIGFYNWKILASVYLSFALISILSAITRKYPGVVPTGLVVLSSSALFYLVTNFTVWLFSPWYVKNIGGLLYAYELGVPFFRNMLIGDVVYTMILLGAIEGVRIISRAYHARSSCVQSKPSESILL
ncbi:MAG: hypothetical protein Q8P11_02475 [bacterium]|nr:hypothetical protein [bacterium]